MDISAAASEQQRYDAPKSSATPRPYLVHPPQRRQQASIRTDRRPRNRMILRRRRWSQIRILAVHEDAAPIYRIIETASWSDLSLQNAEFSSCRSIASVFELTRMILFPPSRLRSIDRGQIHPGQAHVELVLDDFAAKTVDKAPHRRLGAAIDRVRRHQTIGKTDDGRLRTRMRLSADIMPCTCPKYGQSGSAAREPRADAPRAPRAQDGKDRAKEARHQGFAERLSPRWRGRHPRRRS